MENEKICMLALSRIFGWEPATGLALAREMGGAGKVFSAPRREIADIAGEDIARKIDPAELENAAATLTRTRELGADFITIDEKGYPPLLRECPDPPLGLYIRSSTPPEEIFDDRPMVAIVGTRDISSYGKMWCTKIVEALSRCPRKPLIVSGLAIGVDITAHNSALEYGLATAAVMATGVDRIYPFRHGHYADIIASSRGGGLLSDFPPETSPQALNFLRRNRIIAGMCSATILVESRIKGGGMNTARLAFGYDRDVFALPGRIDDLRSQGCNTLIRERVAEGISDLQHLTRALGLGTSGKPRAKDLESIVRGLYEGSVDESQCAKILRMTEAIRANRDISLEELSYLLEMDYGETATLAGILESDGIIEIGLMRNCSINVRYC